MEETEEKSGTRTSTDPKRKTQPDRDEEFRQYSLCCDACRLLWWRDREDVRLVKEKWKKERAGEHRLGGAKIGAVPKLSHNFCLIYNQAP